jgi:cytochrome b
MQQQESRTTLGTRTVLVRDVPVRVFHWLVVMLVAASWVTSEIGGNAMTYHMWIGYSVLTLVLFRIVWGFAGSQHARFRDFVRGPGAVLRYLRGRSDDVHAGHNPAGGWSVLVLLASLAVQTLTGLCTNDEIMTEGPLAARVGAEWSDLLSTVHRYNFYVLLALVAVHVAAVLFYLVVKRENLVGAMISGRKRLPTAAASEARTASSVLAVVALACAAGVVAWIVTLG